MATQQNKTVIIGVSAVVLLIIGVLIGGPILSANSWKSSTLNTTNAATDKINSSAKDITGVLTKISPDTNDSVKLINALNEQNKVLEGLKKDIKEVGGISVIDVTGAYGKMTTLRSDLMKAYSDLHEQNKGLLVSAEFGKEAAKISARMSNQIETPDQAKNLVKSLRELATKGEEFAKTPYATQNDKDGVAVAKEMANILEKLINTGDDAQVYKLMEELDVVTKKFDKIQEQSTKEADALNKKHDKAIDRINELTKKLQ